MDINGPQKIIFNSNNDYKISVIEPEQYIETKKLKTGCDSFGTDVNDFMTSVKDFLEYMESQSKRVEEQKLRSIALRNRVQDEVESRKRSISELKELIETKQKHLERINSEIRSYEEFDRRSSEYKDQLSKI